MFWPKRKMVPGNREKGKGTWVILELLAKENGSADSHLSLPLISNPSSFHISPLMRNGTSPNQHEKWHLRHILRK